MLTEARLTNFNYCGRSMNKLNISTDSKNFYRFSPEKKNQGKISFWSDIGNGKILFQIFIKVPFSIGKDISEYILTKK